MTLTLLDLPRDLLSSPIAKAIGDLASVVSLSLTCKELSDSLAFIRHSLCNGFHFAIICAQNGHSSLLKSFAENYRCYFDDPEVLTEALSKGYYQFAQWLLSVSKRKTFLLEKANYYRAFKNGHFQILKEYPKYSLSSQALARAIVLGRTDIVTQYRSKKIKLSFKDIKNSFKILGKHCSPQSFPEAFETLRGFSARKTSDVTLSDLKNWSLLGMIKSDHFNHDFINDIRTLWLQNQFEIPIRVFKKIAKRRREDIWEFFLGSLDKATFEAKVNCLELIYSLIQRGNIEYLEKLRAAASGPLVENLLRDPSSLSQILGLAIVGFPSTRLDWKVDKYVFRPEKFRKYLHDIISTRIKTVSYIMALEGSFKTEVIRGAIEKIDAQPFLLLIEKLPEFRAKISELTSIDVLSLFRINESRSMKAVFLDRSVLEGLLRILKDTKQTLKDLIVWFGEGVDVALIDSLCPQNPSLIDCTSTSKDLWRDLLKTTTVKFDSKPNLDAMPPKDRWRMVLLHFHAKRESTRRIKWLRERFGAAPCDRVVKFYSTFLEKESTLGLRLPDFDRFFDRISWNVLDHLLSFFGDHFLLRLFEFIRKPPITTFVAMSTALLFIAIVLLSALLSFR